MVHWLLPGYLQACPVNARWHRQLQGGVLPGEHGLEGRLPL
jgi:hypothetical protein